MKNIFTSMIIAGAFFACSKQTAVTPVANTTSTTTPVTYSDTLTYLALGDSYTIGQSVELNQSFPYQLASQLKQAKHFVSIPKIIATTGWTTDDLIKAISASDITDKKYNIVTLLIGVNNQYRGYSKEDYRTEFTQLLNTAIAFAGGNKKQVFVLSIPNWGVTPYAASFDRDKITADINAFNVINKQETDKQGVTYVNITGVSTKAATDASLTARDGLHPSAAMYELWVKELYPAVLQGIK
ncbi:hypothetical protein A0256_03590 [Mucilaginibacter sp. PAMC 26640]|nr:hypothetical protein A0256_03590 [Mucilaginibacter sp. PAMC 26640]